MPYVTLILTRIGQRLLNSSIYAAFLEELEQMRRGETPVHVVNFHFATARLTALILLIPMLMGSLALTSDDASRSVAATVAALLVLPTVYVLWTTALMRLFRESDNSHFQPSLAFTISDALVPALAILGCVAWAWTR